jgi:acyl-CoA reductase-like NAD-dependent aldehyde dehydrogenase
MGDLRVDAGNIGEIYQGDEDRPIYQSEIEEISQVEDSKSSSDDSGFATNPIAVSTDYGGTDTLEAAENKANDLAGEVEECLEEAKEAANEAVNSLAQENDGEALEMAEIADIAARAANEILAQAEGLAADYPDLESIQEAAGEIRKCAALAEQYAQMASKAIFADS